MKLPYFEKQNCSDFDNYTVNTIINKDNCTEIEAINKLQCINNELRKERGLCYYDDGVFSIRLGIIRKLIDYGYILYNDVFEEDSEKNGKN